MVIKQGSTVFFATVGKIWGPFQSLKTPWKYCQQKSPPDT